MLAELKTKQSERAKINKWMDKIGESEQAIRDEVLDNCAKDIEARKYYVGRFESECK